MTPEYVQGQLCKARINGQWTIVIYYKSGYYHGEHYVWTWEEEKESRLERIVNNELEKFTEEEYTAYDKKRVVNHQDAFKSGIRQSYKGLRLANGKTESSILRLDEQG